ncbi:MAG: hypothetical protein Q9220_006461 [cf. Caloplaca sp. 1 TL-2023]
MVVGIDHNALRAQAVETGDDEAVTVNTRDLIDKVLAKYSREWSTLRELIQNAADAAATRVLIKIETRPSVTTPSPQTDDPSTHLKHVLAHHTVDKWIIENNGHAFRLEDWARLKEIAKGNPDESKIGAFGVGFYSVFEIAENPFVSSGPEALEFFWKGDSLFTKRLRYGQPQSTDTVFILPARDRGLSVPQGKTLYSLCRFLTGSITFVGLESIDLWIDGWQVLHLKKSVADGVTLVIPASIGTSTTDKIMQIKQVKQEAVQIEAEWMKAVEWKNHPEASRGSDSPFENAKQSIFSMFKRKPDAASQRKQPPAQDEEQKNISNVEDLTALSRHKVFFHIDQASIQTAPGRQLSSEFLRSRKKAPPKATTLSLLSQTYDERLNSSMSPPSIASELFQSAIPKSNGHVYIGFSTSQTTGLGAHLSIPSLVPTVEREHLDLNSKFIKTWNMELLRAAGIVARISWTSTSSKMQQQLAKTAGMQREGVPTASELEEALPAVRIAQSDMSFIEELPIIPQSLLDIGLVRILKANEVLTDVQVDDIVAILEKSKKTRSPAQLQQLLAYLTGRARINTINREEIQRILNVTVAIHSDEDSGRVIALSEIKEFVNPDKISPDMPLPPSTIPFMYTKTLSKFDIEALGFEELQPLQWLQWLLKGRQRHGHLASQHDIDANPAFSSSVLKVLSKQWSSLSQESKKTVITLLENRTIIPTKLGMKKPTEAYFSSVKLFEDLPVIENLPNVKEPFLTALGVRKTLEIGVVFDRLMSSSSQQWSHVDLIKYLAAVWADVPRSDRERLKTTPVCPAELSPGQSSEVKFRVAELYEPSDSLHRLGLPILHWPGSYSAGSKEGKLLHSLGLRDHPTYDDLVNIIATAAQAGNSSVREYALRYFVENCQSRGYNQASLTQTKIKFLPIQEAEDKLATPSSCFTNEAAALLGFQLIRSDLRQYASLFGVQTDPPVDQCVKKLVNTAPTTKRKAREIFTYMTTRLGAITKQHVDVLGRAPIVPVANKDASEEKGNRYQNLPPDRCFLGDGGDLAKIFDFVDFGPEANMFLLRCGSKHEPSLSEIAQLLIRQPAKFLQELGMPKYMDILVKISKDWSDFKKDKSLFDSMKQAPFLLAFKEEASNDPINIENDEDNTTKIWQLAKASGIIIIDDVINYHIFKSHLMAAPQQDETLEQFYMELGSSELANLVTQRQKVGDVAPNQSVASKLQSTIQERARLYLHDYPKESIRHDSKWLEQNLAIQVVRSIILRKSLKGTNITHTESKTATLHREGTTGWVIYVTTEHDMWQVSQTLAHLLLRRPKPKDSIVLQMLLRSGLRNLQDMGYNIEKILRQKEKEAKVAQELHQEQLKKEQRARKEQDALLQRMEALQPFDKHVGEDPMPGGFPGSRDGKVAVGDQTHDEAGFFTDIAKSFGFDFGHKARQALNDGRQTKSIEPAYPDPESDSVRPPSIQAPKKPMTPHQSRDQIQKAINLSRPHTSSSLRSSPAVHRVEEMHTTCDAKPGMNIQYAGEISNLRIFLDEDVITSPKTSGEHFMTANRDGLKYFASVLQDCATIYKVSPDTVHVFYDENGDTVAFNKANSLFFNYRFFQLNDLSSMEQGKRSGPICEHNLEGDHNTRYQNILQGIIERHVLRIAEVATTPPTASAVGVAS